MSVELQGYRMWLIKTIWHVLNTGTVQMELQSPSIMGRGGGGEQEQRHFRGIVVGSRGRSSRV